MANSVFQKPFLFAILIASVFVTTLVNAKTFEEYELIAPGPITTKLLILIDEIINFRNNQFENYFQELF